MRARETAIPMVRPRTAGRSPWTARRPRWVRWAKTRVKLARCSEPPASVAKPAIRCRSRAHPTAGPNVPFKASVDRRYRVSHRSNATARRCVPHRRRRPIPFVRSAAIWRIPGVPPECSAHPTSPSPGSASVCRGALGAARRMTRADCYRADAAPRARLSATAAASTYASASAQACSSKGSAAINLRSMKPATSRRG